MFFTFIYIDAKISEVRYGMMLQRPFLKCPLMIMTSAAALIAHAAAPTDS